MKNSWTPEIVKYGSKGKLLMLVLTMLGNSLFNLLVALIIGFITSVAMNKFSGPEAILRTAFIYLSAFVVLSLSMFWNVSLKATFERDCMVKVRNMTIQGIVDGTSGTKIGLSFLTNDLKFYMDSAITTELNMLQNIMTFIVSVIAALQISILLSVLYFIAASIPYVITRVFRSSIKNRSVKWQEKNKEYTGFFKRVIDGAQIIRDLQTQNFIYKRSGNVVRAAENEYARLTKATKTIGKIVILSGCLFSSFIPFFIGAIEVAKNVISLSALMTLVQIANNLFNPISEITQLVSDRYAALPIIMKLEKLRESRLFLRTGLIFHSQESSPDAYILSSQFNYTSGVSFSIDGSNRIEIGQRVLIVGPSGVGKSTLLKTIAGIEKAEAGTVSLWMNGRKLAYDSACFLYVEQFPVIFPGTVLDNIVLGQEVDRGQLKEVLEVLKLNQVVLRNNTSFDESQAPILSGGEKQRVALARALLLSRRYLLLDEVTSALDVELSKRVHDYLFSLKRGFAEVSHKVTMTNLQDYDVVLKVKGVGK
ncbi:ABC transporter ATP-binding protein [Lacticaseibacillus casei]|uniref:Multidrug ABC transporter ATP-binding and permease components n=5 Tax=Lacticaseibacillus TaxID=2759736 RepID=A0AAD1ALN2_LACCA|nr:ABC transporter ATP-binding protein [Lacticaseibacillus casei]MBI6598933.1 ABC transporter ATP-binding protein [Lacticaseibacillus casei]MCK2082264.1 ABC transporter ATP-binding protein [Lacticaseibacillus casei]MED7632017.1 ABC transporter ATP-binding protein [Lacticaseibacillus casei]NIG82272.1 ABC transporter ATP-binding protein [Lacticaseibacillus casei]PTU90334.1 ABC transporter ATP-binding protein [Lacticaseibacillus casei]